MKMFHAHLNLAVIPFVLPHEISWFQTEVIAYRNERLASFNEEEKCGRALGTAFVIIFVIVTTTPPSSSSHVEVIQLFSERVRKCAKRMSCAVQFLILILQPGAKKEEGRGDLERKRLSSRLWFSIGQQLCQEGWEREHEKQVLRGNDGKEMKIM